MPYYVRKKMVMSRTVYPLAIESEEVNEKILFPVWCGQPINSENLALMPEPYLVHVAKKKEEVPSIFGGDIQPWHVATEVRRILEDLEPGKHDFIPINVRKEHANENERDFFILHTTSAITDCLVVAETRFADGIGKLDYFGGGQISLRGPIVLSAQKISGHHFWRLGIGKHGGGDPFSNDFFCSDEFYNRMKPHKKALVEFYPCILR